VAKGGGQTPEMPAGRPTRTTIVLVATTSAAAVIDWASKLVASRAFDGRPVDLGPLELRLSHNTGVAFGMGDRLPDPVILAVTAAVMVVFAIAAVRGALGPPVATGLALGGGVANLVDRAVGGSVVDFLDVGWWPTFNLADVFLSAVCVLLAWWSLRTPPADASRLEQGDTSQSL
jgi:signal peptidase II